MILFAVKVGRKEEKKEGVNIKFRSHVHIHFHMCCVAFQPAQLRIILLRASAGAQELLHILSCVLYLGDVDWRTAFTCEFSQFQPCEAMTERDKLRKRYRGWWGRQVICTCFEGWFAILFWSIITAEITCTWGVVPQIMRMNVCLLGDFHVLDLGACSYQFSD